MASLTTGEILSVNYVRMRVTGVGNLQLVLRSLDPNNVNYTMPSVALQTVTNREPMIWSNFMDQRIQLHGFVNQLGEDFTVSRIVIFVKPVATNYPQ